MTKVCDVCKCEIPEDYGNLLCDKHYQEMTGEVVPTPKDERNGITNPDYEENPEMEDKEQWATNIMQFQRTGQLLWKDTRWMYTYIKDYCITKIKEHPQYPKYIWKPKIVDVGCGSGVGSNVLSQEADFVWGIDKNETSVKFAKEAFERIKNNIYYSSQLTYDHVDIVNDTRDFMKFDLVVAIEIIEHIADYQKFLETIIRKFDNRKKGVEATEYFVSTPNRNNKHIQDNKPKNPYHVREWSSTEFFEVLHKYFENIEFMNSKGEHIEGYDTTHTPLLARCSGAKI